MLRTGKVFDASHLAGTGAADASFDGQMDGRGAGTLTSQRRTSTQTVLGNWSHPSAVSAAVERRAHRICRLPAENREPPGVVRYEPGQACECNGRLAWL